MKILMMNIFCHRSKYHHKIRDKRSYFVTNFTSSQPKMPQKVIFLVVKTLSKFAVMADFFSLWTLRASRLKFWVIYYFDQVILMLFLVSCILTQSTKTWWHCTIVFLHCTIPYASSHKHQPTSVFITLSKSVSVGAEAPIGEARGEEREREREHDSKWADGLSPSPQAIGLYL
jgi:hypothetical protein